MKPLIAVIMLTGVLVAGVSAATESAAAVAAGPCPPGSKSREFDFWLGSWDVSLESGERAGANQIVAEQDGCVLVERWAGAKGGTGISLNYYDPESGQWVQNWVGSGGSLIDIRGGIVDGSMRLQGRIQYLGQDQVNGLRGTWTLLSDGRVRQYFEESTDDGKTWKPWFEGFYSRHDSDNNGGG